VHGIIGNRVNFGRRRSPRSVEAYGLAIIFVVVATLIRWGLGFFGDDILVFAVYYPAVLFATYIGGVGVGVFAALLSSVIGWWAFIPPHFTFSLTPAVEIKLAVFLFACALIIWGANYTRNLMNRLEDEEKFRKVVVEELGHRLKNKLVTIQSIISFQLRDEPQVRDAILKRLGALSATDDLIMTAQGEGARLRDILSAEFAPYDMSRISMAGPDCLLSPKLALAISLLVHELVTNASKYGAFSNSTGKISIRWSLFDAQLNLEWGESGGPLVAPPNHHGFGTRLFLRLLDQFNGKVEATFASTGLVCKVNVALPRTPSGTIPRIADNRPKIIAAD
jgi:two-component sensor histidine kinase